MIHSVEKIYSDEKTASAKELNFPGKYIIYFTHTFKNVIISSNENYIDILR